MIASACILGIAILVALAIYAGADTLGATFQTNANGTYVKGASQRSTQTAFQLGQNSMPPLVKTYTTGTGTDQANKMFVNVYTIAGTTNQDLDLAGSLIDDQGNTLTFAAIKEILVIINSPDGTKKLEIGPAAVANAFIGPFADVSDKLTFFDHIRLSHPYAGWTVTAGTGDIMRLRNSSATALDATVIIVGY